MYEGEVTELTPEETENQVGGYGKVISHVIIGLKTVKGLKQLKLDPTIYDNLQKERVQAGPWHPCMKLPENHVWGHGVHLGAGVRASTPDCSDRPSVPCTHCV